MAILRRSFVIYAAGACLVLWPAGRAVAQVAETSPFLPAGVAAGANGGGENAMLELRGIMTTAAGTRFCIYDPVKKSGIWSGLNEHGNTFVIKSADLAHDTVVVQSEGRSLKLTLHEARIAALGPAGPPGAVAPSSPEGAAAPASPADQAQRLAAVAEEVRRRRELRNQQAQQQAAGQRPAP